jgi:hypothetical protein
LLAVVPVVLEQEEMEVGLLNQQSLRNNLRSKWRPK